MVRVSFRHVSTGTRRTSPPHGSRVRQNSRKIHTLTPFFIQLDCTHKLPRLRFKFSLSSVFSFLSSGIFVGAFQLFTFSFASYFCVSSSKEVFFIFVIAFALHCIENGFKQIQNAMLCGKTRTTEYSKRRKSVWNNAKIQFNIRVSLKILDKTGEPVKRNTELFFEVRLYSAFEFKVINGLRQITPYDTRKMLRVTKQRSQPAIAVGENSVEGMARHS